MRRLSAALAALAVGMAGAIASTSSAAADPPSDGPGAAHVLHGYPAAVPTSSDQRIAAWQDLRFGMFVHWGLYSEYAGYYNGEQQTIGYPEQIKAWMDIPDSDYLATAEQFDAAEFNADQWCATAKAAGAKYLVLTSKHHDGFAVWDTATTDYNVVDKTAFGRDPIAELSTACRQQGLGFGLYFSIIDWTLQTPDPWTNTNPIPDEMMPYIQAQLHELLTRYGTLDEIWFDMGAPTTAQSAAMAATVHRLQPTAAVNSRVWNDQGDFEVGGDNVIPADALQGPWQSAYSIFPRCWGYCTWPEIDRSAANLPVQIRAQVRNLFRVVSGGGNYLLNVGPRGDGSIDPFDDAVMTGIGAWQQRHPDVIDGSSATLFPRQAWGDSVVNGNAVYLGVREWPAGGGEITLPGVGNDIAAVTVDGSGEALSYRKDGNDLVVTLPATPADPELPVIAVRTVGTPTVVPDVTVSSTDRQFDVGAADLWSTPSPKNRGREGDVRVTGWIAGLDGNRGNNKARVTVTGSFDPDTRYRVTLGTSETVVTGAQLNAGPVNGLRYRSQQVTPVSVELADPQYFADVLGVTVTGIKVAGYR